MLNSFFTVPMQNLNIEGYLLCAAGSFVCGIFIALVHMFRNEYSKNFILTLVILPAIIQAVIMLVNGNLGTGVAVMGAFSLVRFRSLPGNSREIAGIFLAMAAGLATGMGYIGIAVVMTLSVCAAMIIIIVLKFGEAKNIGKDLKITIPENLEYEGLFDDLLEEYTSACRLMRVKTVSMGSLYELQYKIQFRKDKSEKQFIDQIRCRNGNLTVICGYAATDEQGGLL